MKRIIVWDNTGFAHIYRKAQEEPDVYAHEDTGTKIDNEWNKYILITEGRVISAKEISSTKDDSGEPAMLRRAIYDAAAAMNGATLRVMLWDTGAAHDLLCRQKLGTDARHAYDMDDPITLRTANGKVRADKVVNFHVKELKETARAIVMDNTVEVLSVGYRCMKLGFGYHWEPFAKQCYIVTPAPEGRIIWLEVKNYVPILTAEVEILMKHEEKFGVRNALDSIAAPATMETGEEVINKTSESDNSEIVECKVDQQGGEPRVAPPRRSNKKARRTSPKRSWTK